MTQSRSRALQAAAVSTVLAAAVVTGCSDSSADRSGSPAAAGDLKIGTVPKITTRVDQPVPVEAYLLSDDQWEQLGKAENTLRERCMKRFGIQYTVPSLPVQTTHHSITQYRYGTLDPAANARNGKLAGVYWTVRTGTKTLVRSSLAPGSAEGSSGEDAILVAASPGVLLAAAPHMAEGRVFDAYHEKHAAAVAVIGAGLADRLGITTLETHPAIFIGEEPFTVIGIVDDVQRKAELLLSVVIPRSTGLALWGEPTDVPAKMLISTRIGAAQQVAAEAPTALRPDHPSYLKAVPPPDPKSLRTDVTGDLSQLFLLLASICLVIGAVGIANTTLVAVLERTGEIGLRRALGARGRHISVQFLAESAALGALGGLIGTSLGTITVVIVAAIRDWTPVVHPATVAAAPAIGLVTGLVAGLYPALRASRIQPAEALRR
ncbi:ABC transporter permease [Streptomyces sp. NPDC051320]|uniref:ABC transporter permease n=1 Tax=Streptomyces sp. NPDC051320 TaxID=3154644 RepID=UPI00343CB26E